MHVTKEKNVREKAPAGRCVALYQLKNLKMRKKPQVFISAVKKGPPEMGRPMTLRGLYLDFGFPDWYNSPSSLFLFV